MTEHLWVLNPQQRCDLDLLLTGAYDPVTGFLSRQDYQSVLQRMTLVDGALWPVPIVLDVPEA
ncbi:MAG: adenylyltransferase, partial [Firmicutes bacterium]|nr:adenylyltransferase [Bacillota bacterium]